jgi:hypothetical protein
MTSLVAAGGIVTAQFTVDSSAYQIAVLQYVFAQPVTPASFRFTTDTPDDLEITVETDAGGCTYSHDAATNGIERSITTDWNGCWGTFASLADSAHPTGATKVNLRKAFGSRTMILRGISL